MLQRFPKLAKCVRKHDGVVAIYNNGPCKIGECPHPSKVYWNLGCSMLVCLFACSFWLSLYVPRNLRLATSSDSFRIYNGLQYRLCRICFYGLVRDLPSDKGMVCLRTALKFVSIGVWMRPDADRLSFLCGSRCGAV